MAASLCICSVTTDLLNSFACVLSSVSTPILKAMTRILPWCKVQQGRARLTLYSTYVSREVFEEGISPLLLFKVLDPGCEKPKFDIFRRH